MLCRIINKFMKVTEEKVICVYIYGLAFTLRTYIKEEGPIELQ